MKAQNNMQAIVLNGFGGVENFSATILPIPEPNDNEVLVNIRATAFNPIDYQMRQGATERKRMHSPILGREFSGVVIKTGKAVQHFAVGDAVMAASGSMGSNGTYATHICLPADILVHKPQHLSFAAAAAMPTAALTALQCFKRLQLPTSARIFITGAAGGVGLVLVKLLLAAGYTQLLVTAGNEDSQQQLLLAGLTSSQIIDYHLPDLLQTILIQQEDKLFDACIDLVGGHLSQLCAALLLTNGIYQDVTALSTAAGRETLFHKGAVIINISNYAYSLSGHLQYYGDGLRQITAMLEKGILTPSPVYVTGTLSVETVQQSHELLERNQSKGRKLVMTMAPENE
ncbi:alcohol dehydrogenase catalytic domain-containing protein [Chitinophaga sp.]|uniref:alcohol dehydrogenase catalytic domain-containing protein n=1 Tax=Chitinophaga sp. TaxID=1869181 RepID=UPI002F95BBBD